MSLSVCKKSIDNTLHTAITVQLIIILIIRPLRRRLNMFFRQLNTAQVIRNYFVPLHHTFFRFSLSGHYEKIPENNSRCRFAAQFALYCGTRGGKRYDSTDLQYRRVRDCGQKKHIRNNPAKTSVGHYAAKP